MQEFKYLRYQQRGNEQVSKDKFMAQCKSQGCYPANTVHYIKHPHKCLRCNRPQLCTNCQECIEFSKRQQRNNANRIWMGNKPIITGLSGERIYQQKITGRKVV